MFTVERQDVFIGNKWHPCIMAKGVTKHWAKGYLAYAKELYPNGPHRIVDYFTNEVIEVWNGNGRVVVN